MLGAAHACANPLTARYHIAHGVALAILLPHVVRWNARVDADLYNPFVAATMNGAGGPGSDRLAEWLVRISRAGGFPERLRDTGVREDSLPSLADLASRQWTAAFNPRLLGHPEALEVYRCAY